MVIPIVIDSQQLWTTIAIGTIVQIVLQTEKLSFKGIRRFIVKKERQFQKERRKLIKQHVSHKHLTPLRKCTHPECAPLKRSRTTAES